MKLPNKLFTLLYFLLALTLWVLALPLFIYLKSKKKYRQEVPSRFFLWRNGPFDGEPSFWFHACSLGEVNALKPLVDEFQSEGVAITAITNTGYSAAKKYRAQSRYLPYEIFLPFWARRVDVVVVLEAELWYMLFFTAKLRGAKTVLLNARINEKSLKKYLRFAWFYRRLFSFVDVVYAQSQRDKERLERLGASRVEVVGNIKLAQIPVVSEVYKKPSDLMIVGASTHEGEEAATIEAFLKYNRGKLVIVPRHPERFEAVSQLMSIEAQKHNRTFHRFSNQRDFNSDMVLIDAMGELNNIYAISDIVILGGGFNPMGGHNPLEPVHFKTKIITGHNIFNQLELFKYIEGVQYVHEYDIYDALVKAEIMEPSDLKGRVDIEHVINSLRELKQEQR